MGACIEGIGSNRLLIQGVDRLHGTEFRIGSDFMAVSYTPPRAHETVLDIVCRLLLEKKKISTHKS